MRNSTIHTGALAAAAVALGVSSAATATDDWHGTFRGNWPDGQTTELTVVRIDDGGNAYGAYCHRSSRKVRHFLFDLHPTDGIPARLDDGALRFELGTGKWAFRLDPADPDTVRFAFRRDKTHELELQRADAQTCASRLIQLNPPAAAPPRRTVAENIPDDSDHWAIGSWTATRPTGLAVELTLFDVRKGRGHGIYCNLRDGPTFTVHDVHPEGLDAKVTRNKVKFRINDIRFEFKRTDDDDTLDAVRRHKGKKRTVQATRTTEPACASRVAARRRAP